MSPTKEEALEHPNTRRPERPATPIQGFEETNSDEETADQWQPVADRKIRVGIAGYGVCGFGAAFHFQDHPNVTVAAVDFDAKIREAHNPRQRRKWEERRAVARAARERVLGEFAFPDEAAAADEEAPSEAPEGLKPAT